MITSITAILNNITIKMFFEDKQLPFLIQTLLSIFKHLTQTLKNRLLLKATLE